MLLDPAAFPNDCSGGSCTAAIHQLASLPILPPAAAALKNTNSISVLFDSRIKHHRRAMY
jgi:hypothetical protein